MSFLFFFFCTQNSFSQGSEEPISVTGLVTDTSSKPLAGANVNVKGTSKGTSTDANGKFEIKVPSQKSVLVVSFTGYTPMESRVGTNTNISIQLLQQPGSLNEVVVTGYTAQRKKDIIGAVTVVNTEDLKSTPSANVGAQLQGRASGVTVSTTGDPGSTANVRIRGFSSYGNNSPLYVIDGVPTTDASRLNPQDVETMQVLKDASSASIYGSRAANGVIIVTTKHGKGVRTSVSFDSYFGVQAIPYNNVPEMMGNEDLIKYLTLTTGDTYIDPFFGKHGSFSVPEYYVVSNSFKGGVSGSDPRANPDLYTIADYNNIYQIAKSSPGTDWFKAMTQKGLVQSYQLTASSATDKSSSSIGLNYFSQEGTFKYTGYERYSVRMNATFKPTNYFTFGENVQISYDNRKGDLNITGEQSAWSNAYRMVPYIPVYDIKGGWGGPNIGGAAGIGFNPVASLYRRKDFTNKSLRVFGNVFGDLNIYKGVTFRTSFGIDASEGPFRQVLLQEYERPERRSVTQLYEGSNSFLNWTWTNTLNLQKSFGEHDVKVLLGTEAIKNKFKGVSASKSRYDFEDPNFVSLNTGVPLTLADISATNPFLSTTTLFSYFARLDYTFKGKYLLNGTFRRDGSSLFGPDSRYANFPSLGVGWRVSEEGFMKGLTWINDLKLRGGWGEMGSISNVPALNQYSTFESLAANNFYDINQVNSTTQGYGLSTRGNAETKWETSETIKIGLDITAFQGAWGMSVDVYKKDTRDLLVPQLRNGYEPLVTKPQINLGTMRNTGIDLQLTNKGKISSDLHYDASLTFTHYKNELTKLNNENTPQLAGIGVRMQNVLLTTKGEPISSFFGYQIDGFYNTKEDVDNGLKIGGAPGQIGTWKYKDLNGDGNINTADRTILGSPHPDFQMGLNLGLDWKAFDFTGFLFWNQGNEIFNFTKAYNYMGVLSGNSAKGKLTDAWTPATASTAKTPQLGVGPTNGYTSFVTGNPNSFYVEDGSYLRLKTLQLGYTLPKKLTSKAKISSFRIYIQAQNIFTITKYSGADPDLGLISATQAPPAGQPAGATPSDQNIGVDVSGFPTPRQFLFGLNVSF